MHRSRTLLLAAGCTAAGALGAGAIGSSAHDGNGHRFAIGHHHGFPALFGAIHADAVVPRNDGTFATITFDRGTVDSVSGNELTIREGTADAIYKTVDLNLPDDTKVYLLKKSDRMRHRHMGEDNTASLSDLQAGDKVAVWQSSRKTVVLATRPGSGDSGF